MHAVYICICWITSTSENADMSLLYLINLLFYYLSSEHQYDRAVKQLHV